MKKVSFIKNEEGAMLIEAVLFILFILLPTFLGLVELSSYIRTKEHVNRVAHEMGELFSSIPEWNPVEANNLRVAANMIAKPHGINVSAVFCEGGGATQPVGSQTFQLLVDGGLCGYGDNRVGGGVNYATATCNPANAGFPLGEGDGISAAQYVTVEVGCHYSTMLRFFDFFVGDFISASTISPMRNVVDFDN